MNTQNKIKEIKEHPIMIEVLKDSYGGIIYDVDNREKYNSKELLGLYEQLNNLEKESLDGIIKGAINFLQGK